jgi:hypothetical protein
LTLRSPINRAESEAGQHAVIVLPDEASGPLDGDIESHLDMREASDAVSYLAVALLVLVLFVGAALRLANLADAEFVNDELNHYFAAQEVEGSAGLVLPSGERYSRAANHTRLVRVALAHISDPHLAARLPSVVFGVLSLVLLGLIGWRLAGPWAAVFATALLAVYPSAVYLSRMSRFYSYQLALGLVALFAVWMLVRRAGTLRRSAALAVWPQWMWALVAGAAFLMAASAQMTTLSVAVGAGMIVAAAGLWDLRTMGRAAWRESVPLQLAVIGLVGASLLPLVRPGLIPFLLVEASYVPDWAGGTGGSRLAYYYALSDALPFIVGLLPAIFLTLLVLDLRKGVFLGLWFGIPFFLHSFVFGFKQERYILLAMPALFLAVAIVAVHAGTALRELLSRSLPASRVSQAAAGLLVLGALTFVLLSSSAFSASRRLAVNAGEAERPMWRAAGRIIAEGALADGAWIGSSDAIASLYYWPRVDFSVSSTAAQRHSDRFAGVQASAPGGVPADYYVGVPVLATPEMILEHAPEGAVILIAIDDLRVRSGSVLSELTMRLEREGEELCDGRCGRLHLYSWTAAPNAEHGSPGSVSGTSIPAVP